MELMSSLLLCALAAALPQALGESLRPSEIVFNRKSNATVHKQLLINMNTPPLVNSVTEIQSIFKDVSCRNCINCMQRAVKAHLRQSKYKMMHVKPILDELHYGVLSENHPMGKRSINETKLEEKDKSKHRGIKRNNPITVTKYSDENGKVFALKVKELSSKNSTNGKKYTCKVYSVSQSLACDSLGGTIEGPKKKVKRDKKSKHKISTSTSTTTATPFKKRETFNFEVSESYMPSVEDMY